MAEPNLKLTEQEREEFLAGKHVGVLSVASDDERPPLSAPVWYAYQPGGNITFFTGTQGHRARKEGLLKKAGVMTFVVQSEEWPYKYVSVEGTVIGADHPPTAEQVLTIVRRYLPENQAQGFAKRELEHPDSKFVLFTIRPDRWSSIDYGKLEQHRG